MKYLFVISAPSATGKNYVKNELINRHTGILDNIISSTSRLPRPGEMNAKDYFFVDKSAFYQDDKKWLALAQTYGNFYAIDENYLLDTLEKKPAVVILDFRGYIDIKTQLMGKANVMGFYMRPISTNLAFDRMVGRVGKPYEELDADTRQDIFRRLEYDIRQDHNSIAHNYDFCFDADKAMEGIDFVVNQFIR